MRRHISVLPLFWGVGFRVSCLSFEVFGGRELRVWCFVFGVLVTCFAVRSEGLTPGPSLTDARIPVIQLTISRG